MKNTVRELDFKDKRETLTMSELALTVDESMLGGNEKKMRHSDFIGEIQQMLDKRKLQIIEDPIHIRQGGASQMPNVTFIQNVAKEYKGDSPLEAHLIRNMMGKFQINDLSDEISNQALAFTINQMGVQVAFGMNVHACSNLSIWGENVIYSYGRNKHSVREIFSTIGDWLDLLEKKRNIDVSYMQKLIDLKADHSDVLKLIGELLVQASKNNMKKEFSDVIAPLNDTQVSAFAKDYVRKYNKIEKLSVENMWDVYNIGTALLRPEKVNNFEPIFQQNKTLGDFMVERYQLN